MTENAQKVNSQGVKVTLEAPRVRYSVNPKLQRLPRDKAEKDHMAGAPSATGWRDKEAGIDELMGDLGNGWAIGPIYQDGKRDNDHWRGSTFIPLDFDSGTDVPTLQAHPFSQQYTVVIGATPSHTPDNPRSRIILPLAEPITDAKLHKRYAQRVEHQYAEYQPDSSASEPARFFFGLRKDRLVCLLNGGLVTIADLEALPPSPAELAEQESERRREAALHEQRQTPRENGHISRYAQAALEGEVQAVRTAIEGNRNATLNLSAFSVGQLVSAGALTHLEVENALYSAGIASGLDEQETRKTIKSGLDAGMKHPRMIPDATPRRNANTRPAPALPPVEMVNGQKYITGAPEPQFQPDTLAQQPVAENVTPFGDPKTPTQDEMGDKLTVKWGDERKFFRGAWHGYRLGFWEQLYNPDADLWDVMIEHKPNGVRPTPQIKRGIDDYLQTRLMIADLAVDNGENYINLKNGLLNLTTGKLEPHRPELYLTSQLGFNHDPAATCTEWELSLGSWLTTPDGLPDKELIALVQEAIGYSLTTDTSHQVSFWLVGLPASGKSTLINTLIALMGNAHVAIDLSALDKNQYQLASIPGKRVITCTEAATQSVLADNYYKALVSGEMLPVREIREKTFWFTPQVKIWWAMNEKPRNLDRSGAVDRRIYIIPFNHQIPEASQDPLLYMRLVNELPGIFNWALEGLRRLRQNGRFTQPKQVLDAREQYRAENDTEAAFIADWCVCDEQQTLKSSELYHAYQLWCARNGHRAKRNIKVGSDWRRLGFEAIHTREGNAWRGIGLNVEALKAIGFSGSHDDAGVKADF